MAQCVCTYPCSPIPSWNTRMCTNTRNCLLYLHTIVHNHLYYPTCIRSYLKHIRHHISTKGIPTTIIHRDRIRYLRVSKLAHRGSGENAARFYWILSVALNGSIRSEVRLMKPTAVEHYSDVIMIAMASQITGCL